VVPYSTWVVEASSVIQLISAEFPVIVLATMLDMAGALVSGAEAAPAVERVAPPHKNRSKTKRQEIPFFIDDKPNMPKCHKYIPVTIQQ